MKKKGFVDLYQDKWLWQELLGKLHPNKNIIGLRRQRLRDDEVSATCRVAGFAEVTLTLKRDGMIFVHMKEKSWSDLKSYSPAKELPMMNSILVNSGYDFVLKIDALS